ncbi:MAG: hypothetical protein HC802_14415 [Caldilineaceae bacterium]|nr:hypothetical protein [Caldilineaceae bacterium]
MTQYAAVITVHKTATNVTPQIKQVSTAGSRFVPGAPFATGTYSLNLTMLNTGTMLLEDLFFKVQPSWNISNTLVNRDPDSPPSVGATKTVDDGDLPGGNGIWDPGETHTEFFVLGLNYPSFKVIFNLYTWVAVTADVSAEPLLVATFEVDLDPTKLVEHEHRVYLPFLVK